MHEVASVEDRQRVRSELFIRTYRSKADRMWRWQVQNKGNHEIEGAACQGYADRRDCDYNLMRLTGFTADVVVDEGP